MTTIPPATDSTAAMQRKAHQVLGRLLAFDLPVLDWDLHITRSGAHAILLPPDRELAEVSERTAEALFAWWRALPDARSESGERYEDRDWICWSLDTRVQDVRVTITAYLGAEWAAQHPLPACVPLLPVLSADQFVRRTPTGEFAAVYAAAAVEL